MRKRNNSIFEQLRKAKGPPKPSTRTDNPGTKRKSPQRLTPKTNRGLGAQIAHAFAAQGSNIAINYASNASAADNLAQELTSSYPEIKTTTLRADASSSSEIATLVSAAARDLGGLDIVIANAGWTRFSDFADLDALTDEEWDRCWRTNVVGVKSLVSNSMPFFNANPEGGVFLVTSSIAGRTIGGSSMAYSVTKAAQLHLVKCVAKSQGGKVRVNAVLPGLLLTEWGLEYGEERIEGLREAAVLKREVSWSSFLPFLFVGWLLVLVGRTCGVAAWFEGLSLLTLFALRESHRPISRTARICLSPWPRIRVSRASTFKSTPALLFNTFEVSIVEREVGTGFEAMQRFDGRGFVW